MSWRDELIEKAAKDLVEKLEHIHKSPEYLSVWTINQLHTGPYKGPNYTEELRALKAALKEPTDG